MEIYCATLTNSQNPCPICESYHHKQITSEAVQSCKITALSAHMLGTQVAIAAEPSCMHAFKKRNLLGRAPKRPPNKKLEVFLERYTPPDHCKLRNHAH